MLCNKYYILYKIDHVILILHLDTVDPQAPTITSENTTYVLFCSHYLYSMIQLKYCQCQHLMFKFCSPLFVRQRTCILFRYLR